MHCAINILAVDDEKSFLESIKRALVAAGFQQPILESDPLAAADFFGQNDLSIDVALIDITMPGMSGEELLVHIRQQSPHTECIMISAINDAETAVRCLKIGAYDYLVKPLSPAALIGALSRALERKRLLELLELGKQKNVSPVECQEAFISMVTKTESMFKVLKEAELHALSNVPVLITGESGTGKELLARAIHMVSNRKKHPFTAVNMASMNNSLFEADFFGHTKGAFTGANQDRQGYLEYTGQGTLFLDEIGSIPLETQGKLLRALQEGEYFKLGTNTPRRSKVRFVAATNADLDRLLAAGDFRKDFYYRLKGAWLHLPPLRERPEDIPLLIHRFIDEYGGSEFDNPIDDRALSQLMKYHYPGNVRELKFIIQSALNLSRKSPIKTIHLPQHLRTGGLSSSKPSPASNIMPLEEVQQKHVIRVYHQTGRNKVQTAKLLQIGLNTLRRKLQDYGEK